MSFVFILTTSALGSEVTQVSTQSEGTSSQRALSVFISQDFLNEQMQTHLKSNTNVQNLKILLDPEQDQILLRGTMRMPMEELRAINLDPKLGKFHFQMALKARTSSKGHLVLEFPLNKTFFYPADSTDPLQDRVIIPVQMLSLGLASARGYLAALSGDFSTFDRQTEMIEGIIKVLEHKIAIEKNPNIMASLKNEKESYRLKLAAVPIERKQLESISKEYEALVAFTGEKELTLNDELAAEKNALILKVKLSQLAPFLNGIELGGIRIVHDKKDGAGENYLAVDVNSQLAQNMPVPSPPKHIARAGMKVAPALIIRLNQALLESEAVVSAEKKGMPSKLRAFDIEFKDDGLHISGKWKTLLVSIPFDTVVDFITTGTDVFEVRVGEIKVAGIDVEFMNKFILESVKKRLDKTLKGICAFDYLDDNKSHGGSLRVTVDPKKLVPAFPDLHLVAVDVRDKEFLLKVGKPEI